MRPVKTLQPFLIGHPTRGPRLQLQPGREQLEAWVRRFGANTTSYVLLEGPKSYFTSRVCDGFIAYQISAGTAVIGGDPVCHPAEAAFFIREFVWEMKPRPVVAYQVSPSMLPAFRRAGFADVQIGTEAIFDLHRFTLAGGQLELVRAATNKARRAGVVVTEHRPLVLGAKSTNQELLSISREWLKEKGDQELGFLLGSLNFEQRSRKRYFIARSGEGRGRIEGFIVCDPVYGRNGYYLDVTRRRTDAVRGTMELLTTEIFRILREEGYDVASMGLAPLALLDDPDLGSHPRLTRLMRFAYERVGDTYDFKLLYRYKAKYHPHAWERRYLCFNQRTLSPRMLYSLLKVRNALTLKRLVARNPDESRGIQENFKSWKHAASLAVGFCWAFLSSS